MLALEKIKKCVIPAAGLGKRFYPLTRAQPKEMLPILDKPVIHYVVEEAVNSGLDEILIIVGAGKESIINYFDKHRLDEEMDDYGISNIPDIYFVRQKEQKGLADAIRYAEGFTGDESFVVLLGDTIYRSHTSGTVTSHIIDSHYKTMCQTVAVETVPDSKVQDYGIIDAVETEEGMYRIRNIVEKPSLAEAPGRLGITGIYVLENNIYQYLEKIKPGRNNEYQLADAFNLYLKEKEMYAKKIDGTRYDIGTKELWVETFLKFAAEDERFKTSFSKP